MKTICIKFLTDKTDSGSDALDTDASDATDAPNVTAAPDLTATRTHRKLTRPKTTVKYTVELFEKDKDGKPFGNAGIFR